MKKRIIYSSIICLQLFLLSSCVKNESKDYIREDYNLFSNNSLIIDSTKNNEIRFEKLTDTTLVLSKEGLKYSFSLDRLEDILSEDVYDFFNISTLNYSELKLKKFNESDELKSKKDSISSLKKNILQTLILFDSIPACGPHYDLKKGFFDFSSVAIYPFINSGFNWNIDKFIFTPENEDVALIIEDSCSNISLNIYAHIQEFIYNTYRLAPTKFELYNKATNQQIMGVGKFLYVTNSVNHKNYIEKSKKNSIIKTKELSMTIPLKFKKLNDRMVYGNSMLILNYGHDSPMFIIQVIKEPASGFNSEGFSNLEKYLFDEIKNKLIPNAILHSKKVSRIDNKKSLCLNFEHYNNQLNKDVISDYNVVYHNGYLYKISFGYSRDDVDYSKSLIQNIKKTIKFK